MNTLKNRIAVSAIMGLILCNSHFAFASGQGKIKGKSAKSDKYIEISESGSPIYRHKEKEHEWRAPKHATQFLEEISAHIEKHIGQIETVYHETVSDLVHIDIHLIPATRQCPYHVLVTSGVSDEPMTVPDGMGKFRRAELLIALPKDWLLTEESFRNEANYWPLRWLKQVGRLPHEYETWIGWGHTIPNGDPPEAIADTDFVGAMVTLPYILPPDVFQLTTKSGEVISFYMLVPLYKEELDLKLKKGAEELERRFEKENINLVLDTKRPNVAKKK